MTREQFKKHLISNQANIRFESPDDEGAAEYWGQLDYLIELINNQNVTDQQIKEECDNLGERCYLV